MHLGRPASDASPMFRDFRAARSDFRPNSPVVGPQQRGFVTRTNKSGDCRPPPAVGVETRMRMHFRSCRCMMAVVTYSHVMPDGPGHPRASVAFPVSVPPRQSNSISAKTDKTRCIESARDSFP